MAPKRGDEWRENLPNQSEQSRLDKAVGSIFVSPKTYVICLDFPPLSYKAM